MVFYIYCLSSYQRNFEHVKLSPLYKKLLLSCATLKNSITIIIAVQCFDKFRIQTRDHRSTDQSANHYFTLRPSGTLQFSGLHMMISQNFFCVCLF